MTRQHRIIPELTPQQLSNFWAKVQTGNADKCWPWLAARSPKGYGQFGVNGMILQAHRIAFFLANGPIPDGLSICHRCDNPPCVNPAHLFLGTNRENSDDRQRKGRQVVLCGDKHWSRVHPERTTRGERDGNAKLTADAVRAIRTLYKGKNGPCLRELAETYGVSKHAIHSVVRRETWAHIT